MRFCPSFLGIFALILSCGPAPEGPPDTVVVGSGTQSSGDVVLAPGAVTELVGFSGARFAVLDAGDGTLVFDADARAAFRVAGRAVRTPYIGSDMWMDVNLTGNESTSKLEASADGRRILVRTEKGIEVIDLGNHGASLASANGTTSGNGTTSEASMAPDGESFTTWNEGEVAVVRIADGARVAYPRTPARSTEPAITWTPKSVSWTDAAGASLVDRATWHLQHIAMEGAMLAVSKDGGAAAVYRSGAPALVEVWRTGETKPAAHVASAFASNLIMDAAGSRVAWVEHSGNTDARAYLHTLDVASGAHARFAAKAAPCQLSPEYLVAIENGELRTDGECNPGCPSISRQPDYLAYDFASGRVVRHWIGEAEPPYNDELSVRSFAAQQLAKRYGFDKEAPLPIVHHPSREIVLVEGPDALRIAEVVSGDDLATLRRSAGFTAASAHFWPGAGALVVGVHAGAIGIWDAATGTQVWSTSP